MCSDCFDEDALDDALQDARYELHHGARGSEEPQAFIYACRLSEIPQNGSRGKTIVAEHDEIALFLLSGVVYAISNICPHQLSPLLAEGYIDKEAQTVTCPLHGWVYHIPTGKFVGGSGSIRTYQVKVLDDEVWVEEPQATSDMVYPIEDYPVDDN